MFLGMLVVVPTQMGENTARILLHRRVRFHQLGIAIRQYCRLRLQVEEHRATAEKRFDVQRVTCGEEFGTVGHEPAFAAGPFQKRSHSIIIHRRMEQKKRHGSHRGVFVCMTPRGFEAVGELPTNHGLSAPPPNDPVTESVTPDVLSTFVAVLSQEQRAQLLKLLGGG